MVYTVYATGGHNDVKFGDDPEFPEGVANNDDVNDDVMSVQSNSPARTPALSGLTGMTPQLETLMAIMKPMMEGMTAPLMVLIKAQSSSSKKKRQDDDDDWL